MRDSQSVFLAHADDVWRTVMRILNDSEKAKECYQQVFVDLTRVEPKTVRNWGALLRQIATRRAMDSLRQSYRHRAEALIENDMGREQPPDASLLHDELRDAIRDVLVDMPPQQAEAFWMRHIEKMTPSEIASEMQIEPGHVRVLVHRAIAVLKSALSESFDPSMSAGRNP